MSEVIEGQVVDSTETTDLAVRGDRPRLTLQMAKEAEEQAAIMGRIARAAVATTSPEQWTAFGDKMYPHGDAGLTMARCVGLTIEKVKEEWPDIGGGVLQCVMTVNVSKGDRDFDDTGDCDQFDDGLAKRKRELEQQGATPEQVMALLKSDMRKKAYMNAVSRAVSGWLGVKGLTKTTLEAMGLKFDDTQHVNMRKGAKGGKVELATIADALKLPKGSHVSIRGSLVRGNEASGTKGPYCRLIVKDATGELNITMWSGRPEWMETGCGIFLPDVEMGEYQGKPQGTAKAAELVEQEAADGNGK